MKALKRTFRKKKRVLFLFTVLTLSLFLVSYNLLFLGLIFPKTFVAGVPVSGKTPAEAAKFLAENVPAVDRLELVSEKESFILGLSELNFSYSFEESATAAFSSFRTGNLFYDLYKRLTAFFKKSEVGLRFNLDEQKLNEALSVIDSKISTPAVYPSVKLVGKEIVVNKGSAGVELDKEKVSFEIYKNLAQASLAPVPLLVKTNDPSINEVEATALKQRAEKISAKSLVFEFEFQTFTFTQEETLPLLSPDGGYHKDQVNSAAAKIAASVNRPPQEPTFVFEGGRVKEFAPAKNGISLREETFEEMLIGNLVTLEISDEKQITVELPVDKLAPKVKTEEVNNLGVKELIGRGSSLFAHSIANRIYNIGLASSRFKGVLVAPGEIFSFNDVLGDVSALTGYKQAFVIKDGRTVLGDGGGVCQVSTTFFRAALDAGLPIVERRAHSYRVGYYEQDSPPGLDATVFAPSTDLKIKNDTPGHILIQTIFDAKSQTIVFEFYGTKDGRVATTTKPKVSGVIPPPPDLYVDDPTLPAGTIKQVDFKASGAKASFDYKVTRGGEEIYSKTFFSNYQPWQAVFLKGIGPNQ